MLARTTGRSEINTARILEAFIFGWNLVWGKIHVGKRGVSTRNDEADHVIVIGPDFGQLQPRGSLGTSGYVSMRA